MKMQLPASTLANIRPPDKTNYKYFQFWNDKPFAKKPDFDLVNAWRLCEFALIAYADRAFIEDQTKELKAAGYVIDTDGSTETEYVFVSGPDDLVVAFRGTEIDNFWGSVHDWLTDFKVHLRGDEHGNRIHTGFTAALDRVWKGLNDRIQDVVRRNRKIRIWITGHSLGAALANVAAYRATVNGFFDVHAVYTFGSPRVGDDGFKRYFVTSSLDDRTFRFRNNSDIVTRVPPFPDYVHVGKSQFIDNSGHLHVNTEAAAENGTMAVATAITEVIGLVPCLLPGADQTRPVPGAIGDHGPTFYAMHLFNSL
jgi:triacylglycerol lipase